jgi:hypothetical protein
LVSCHCSLINVSPTTTTTTTRTTRTTRTTTRTTTKQNLDPRCTYVHAGKNRGINLKKGFLG